MFENNWGEMRLWITTSSQAPLKQITIDLLGSLVIGTMRQSANRKHFHVRKVHDKTHSGRDSVLSVSLGSSIASAIVFTQQNYLISVTLQKYIVNITFHYKFLVTFSYFSSHRPTLWQFVCLYTMNVSHFNKQR